MIKKTIAAGIVALGALTGTSSQAANIDLAFIMDSSGSVGSTNYNNAMDSLAAALSTYIPVGGANTYRIGVISFASNARVDVFKTISTAQDLTDVVNAVDNASFIGTNTDYEEAFDLVRTTFGSLGDSSIVNMMTDGEPCCVSTANADAVSARNDLKAAGWDSLSFESIGGGADNAFLASLGFDTNGDGATIIGDAGLITNPLDDAFVLQVSGFGSAYDSAIQRKVQKIVDPDPIPVPAALPLLAGGLAIFGFVGRRRRQAA